MIDDRICIFYVADMVEDICKQQRKLKEKLRESMDPKEFLKDDYDLHVAETFLRELHHNIGVNIRRKKAEAGAKAVKQMLEDYKSQKDLVDNKRGSNERKLPRVIVAYEYKTGAGNRRKWKYPNERFGPKHWERFPDGHKHDMVIMGTYVLQEKED